MWSGVRNFEGRRPYLAVILAGAVIWLLACQIEAFYVTPKARVMLMALIVVFYTVLSVTEFWRAREPGLMSRWPLIVLLLVHATVFLIRIPLAGTLPFPVDEQSYFGHWYALVVFETVFYTVCVAYFLGSIAKERIVVFFQQASLMDPLTGVPNRRAFFERGTRLLRRSAIDHRPITLLVCDLDRFKQINDTFGHETGDRILIAFCGVVTGVLRTNDLFSRLGGEEFACLLPRTSQPDAVAVAERIRSGFEATSVTIQGRQVRATVSIGIAVARTENSKLTALLAEADQALYRAKERGRNRIELSRPPLVGVELRRELIAHTSQ